MPKQRFYIWTTDGSSCPLAYRLHEEGYEVVIRIEDHWMRDNLEGIVRKTNSRPAHSDIVIVDSNNNAQRANSLREAGYSVIGGSEVEENDDVGYLLESNDNLCLGIYGWFNGEEWLEHRWSASIAASQPYVGNLGPVGPAQWSAVWNGSYTKSFVEKFYTETTAKLSEEGYVGFWCWKCLVEPDGVSLLYEHAGFEPCALAAYGTLLQQPLGEALIELVGEGETFHGEQENNIAIALAIGVPPFPFASNAHTAMDGAPIKFSQEDKGSLWLSGVKSSRFGLITAETNGLVGYVTALGKAGELFGVMEDVRQRARRFDLTDCYWRDDPGSGVERQWYQLNELGFESPTSLILSATAVITPIGSSL